MTQSLPDLKEFAILSLIIEDLEFGGGKQEGEKVTPNSPLRNKQCLHVGDLSDLFTVH